MRAEIALSVRALHELQAGIKVLPEDWALQELPLLDLVLVRPQSVALAGLLEETLEGEVLIASD